MYADLWLKRVLVPAWVAQIVLNGLCLAFTAFLLSFLHRVSVTDHGRAHDDDFFTDSDLTQAELDQLLKWAYISTGISIAISSVGIIFSAVEILQFARKRLSPVLMVVLNALAVLVWIIIVALSAWSSSRELTLGFLWPLLLFLVYVAKLIYASVILHRVRKGRAGARGTYAAPAEMGVAYTGSTAYNAGAKHANTEYYSPDNVGYSGRA